MMDRPPAPRLRVLSCPQCGSPVTLRAAGASVSAVCGACRATLDVADDAALRVIAAAQAATRTPAIPIGTRATLVGTLWEVVGYQRRSDPAQDAQWDEYLLFNPYQGFRFLVHDDPDWVLYAVLQQDVPDPAAFGGRRYKPLRSGTSRTDYVLGEFYWRARVGDEVSSQEFEAAPYLLSREQNAAEVTWSRGLQLAAAAVQTAFGVDAAVAPPTQVDQAQAQRRRRRAVWLIWAIAMELLYLSSRVSLDRNHRATVFSHTFVFTAADKGRPTVSEAFAVPGAGGNLAVDAQSPVSNAWVELGWSLVNQDTQQALSAAATIEAYSGVDSDGPWSEGDDTAQAVFPRVPAGTYRLLMDVDAAAFDPNAMDLDSSFRLVPGGPAKPVSVQVRLVRHENSALNFWLAVLALLPYPVWRSLVDRANPATPKKLMQPGARR